MSFLQSLPSLLMAGLLLLDGALDVMAPQNDMDGSLFLCNRQWMVSAKYVPETVDSGVPGQVREMRPEAAAALKEMYDACFEETGAVLTAISGYRSYYTQQAIWKRKLGRVNGSVARAQHYVAPPGSSEHQLGLAMDIGQKNKGGLTSSFGKTEGGKWVRENCWRFGFVLRYGEEWEDITGYKFEPWHFRYVGKKYAKEIHDADIPLETWLLQHRTDTFVSLLSDN